VYSDTQFEVSFQDQRERGSQEQLFCSQAQTMLEIQGQKKKEKKRERKKQANY
jgi:hypothetical protein